MKNKTEIYCYTFKFWVNIFNNFPGLNMLFAPIEKSPYRIEIQFKVLDIFADYDEKYQEAHGLWSPTPVIILNGLKSIETEFKWTKLDGSMLNYTGNYDIDYGIYDVDYGFTAFSENQIYGNVVENNCNKNE